MADRAPDPGASLGSVAHALSRRHRIGSASPREAPAWGALPRLPHWLAEARRACAAAPPDAGKAAEWLLDNDYQLHRAIRQIRQDLPADYYARLPALDDTGGGWPRTYDIAHELLRATHLQLGLQSAIRFVRAYQRRAPLTIAELWAFPTMLRIACIEIVACALAPLMEGRVPPPFDVPAFAHDRQSIDETERVARGVANLGLIASIPWDEFFEATSQVEEMLRGDPAGVYAGMDFETRDRYRRAVEDIARASAGDEIAAALAVARRAAAADAADAAHHVGYWLIGEGRAAIETALGAQVPRAERLRRLALAHPGRVYSAALALCAAGSLLLPAWYLAALGATAAEWAAALAASFIPATILAVTIVHWIITRALHPHILPKLDCSDGLPADCPTIVAVPVVLSGVSELPALLEQLETHWLANADPMLQVALLADLADAPYETLPGDAEIIAALEARVNRLNRERGRRKPFHLLVRPRRFNSAEGCWMAWERKRGKLEQFNRLLIEGDRSAFSHHVGDPKRLAGIRFVVTVDADTMLPPASVAKLVGTLAHPLNAARFDPESGRVVAGYSIIQPRTEISPASGTRTLFARLFTGDTAIDIYSRAVSDVYQDLFGAGIFVGKGIYDLAAFHRSVDGRVPENSILSHDLFEGAHARVGLATDILLYEGFPGTYLEYARRLHRWIRGDWQLLPWLARNVPGAGGQRLRGTFAAIDRWKILDNLRRSLIAPSLMLLLLAGWFVLPGNPWFWTVLAVLAPAGQLFADLVGGLARGRRRGAVRGLFRSLSDQAGRWLLAIVYLPHEAILSVHAIIVTLWRVTISHRHLLEWTAAAHVAARLAGSTPAATWRQMAASPAASIILGAALLAWRPEALPVAAPLLLLWLLAPAITVRIGRTRMRAAAPLQPGDRQYLRLVARRTWFFFECFAGPEDNWLPPDNYQAPPHEEIAHRTSPTNIAMLLLSTATAWDLGYIGRAELAARTEAIFDSLDRLERYRGHFLNWYDTRTLEPLEPRYVSVVDSGNLAACLVAFASALEAAARISELEPQRWDGLGDVIALLGEAGADPAIEALRWRLDGIKLAPERWSSALGELCDAALPGIETEISRGAADERSNAERLQECRDWLERLRGQAKAMLRDLSAPGAGRETLLALAARAASLANAMEFEPFYDRQRELFHIGYNVTSGRTDTHHYDLLASEARLASFFAVAKGDVPPEHWFHLGRPVTRGRGGLTLLSWNGSMFEYLMPRLLLRPGPESLLGESEFVAGLMQRRHGKTNGLPWGISESAYAARDPEQRYRYQAFGVPGLGLRRGLARDHVIAPYASALALATLPGAAVANLKRLAAMGASGPYGFIEAVDFTADRREGSDPFTPVAAYMAHHQGMILCAIGNLLTDDVHVERFAADARIRLGYLLLSERIPREIPSEIERIEDIDRQAPHAKPARTPQSWEPLLPAAGPQMQLLSNGRLSSWVSEAGGGGLRWRGQAITRFVPDFTRDCDGIWLYLVDDEDSALWSATRQPAQAFPDEYRAVFHAHLAEFHRRDKGIETRLEIGVAGREDVEIRRVTLVNESGRSRRLRLTSYAEIVLAPPLDDERHPAFSKLFVRGETVPELGGVLFTRRARGPHEAPPAMVHFLVGAEGLVADATFECDRRAFVGRGGVLRRPVGARKVLANGTGWTMDPVAALQCGIELAPHARCELAFVTVVAPTREAALEIAERHATLASLEWALLDAASEMAQVVDRAGVDPARLAAVSMLASQLLYPHGLLRAAPARRALNRLGQSDLWGMALSGDLPILLLRTGGDRQSECLSELVAAHQFWRRQGFECDLVILQTGGSAYAEPMREGLAGLLRSIGSQEALGRRGGVHLLFADQIGTDHVLLLEAAARVVLDDALEPIEDRIVGAVAETAPIPLLAPSRPAGHSRTRPVARPENLLFDNGIGGFTPDGREYVIYLAPGETTPAPWSNILANETFGTLVTEAGGGFTWAQNSGEFRLTGWANDPVCDRPGEVLYLRDEETAEIWSVTPAPLGHEAACEIRHGAGYSRWTRRSHGLAQDLLVFVPAGAPVKLVRLQLRNLTKRHRRLTSTCYAEWLLGAMTSRARERIVCSRAEHSRGELLLATSFWSGDFAGCTAFLAASRRAHGVTTDRREFLGAEGDVDCPAGLLRWGLSGTVGGEGDPCAAYQVHHDLAPGGTDEILFVIGAADDPAAAADLAAHWTDGREADAAFAALAHAWDDVLGRVEVRTPDPAFDLMVNRWLLYQARASRILARTGYYQSSGAIGFRDQLQDMLALLHCEPARVRAHLLECARHQFGEGDVLHWWHPPADRGVRTRCSDDMLWLPYAAGTYVAATGDLSILDEQVPFLDAPPLAATETDRYARFDRGAGQRPFLEHCERALEHAFTQGPHGLPLIGSGDWNDGMDRLGIAGRGESIWLAWFGAVTAELMAAMQLRLGRADAAGRWRERAAELRRRGDAAGWDGAWYRRAYDDDGRPVGSAREAECRIDSISQSWAILAGANAERADAGLAAARTELLMSDVNLARLLWPPFGGDLRDPGYIAAYPPGVRENGGQYSHAAAWLGLAFAQRKDGAAARDIFAMLNPVSHAGSAAGAAIYRGEPYAVAGDICAAPPHTGRAGWTWYTGAAAWGWRLAVEGILGIGLAGDAVVIDPALPDDWAEAGIRLARPGGVLDIRIRRLAGAGKRQLSIEVDGKPVHGRAVAFPSDGTTRLVVATIAPGTTGQDR